MLGTSELFDDPHGAGRDALFHVVGPDDVVRGTIEVQHVMSGLDGSPLGGLADKAGAAGNDDAHQFPFS